MTHKLFVDSDVILDLLAKRDLFFHHAALFFTYAERNNCRLYTSPLVFANVFYILRKSIGNHEAKKQLKKIRLMIQILPIYEKTIDMALNSELNDFEDAIQYFCAKENGLFGIITRNTKHYKIKDIVVQSPAEYISGVSL
jgi:predicted nucleic acid-binding protein